MSPPLYPFTLALYAIAATLFLSPLFAEKQEGVRPLSLARIILAGAFLSQAADIAWLCFHGLHPGSSAKEAVFFAGWLMCGIFLLASLRFYVPIVGAMVVPIVLVLSMATRLHTTRLEHPTLDGLGVTHIVLATLGVALFAIAAGGAAIYLLEERNLKAHRPSRLFRSGGALTTLDSMSRRLVNIGFPLFTFAMITGAVWSMRSPSGLGLLHPQYLAASVAWLLYGALVIARVAAGLRGRRAAWLTLWGFASAMAVVILYLVREGGVG